MSQTPARPSIELEPDGPLIVRGLERFVNSHGDAIRTRPEMRLCRCGNSRNKPFCDSTHKRVGFVADDTAPRR